MKYLIQILCFLFFATSLFSGCKAKYSFKSYEGKKKLDYYNSIQYGGGATPNYQKGNKKKKH